MAGRLEINERLVKAYMGHSPGYMLGTHYMKIDTQDLRQVSSAMDGWRGLNQTKSECRHR